MYITLCVCIQEVEYGLCYEVSLYRKQRLLEHIFIHEFRCTCIQEVCTSKLTVSFRSRKRYSLLYAGKYISIEIQDYIRMKLLTDLYVSI